MTRPRIPTAEELDVIATATQQEIQPTYAEKEEHRLNVGEQEISVFDKYVSDGPGYAGRVAVIVWGGGPELVSVVTLDSNPPRHHTGELEATEPPAPPRKHFHEMSVHANNGHLENSDVAERIATCFGEIHKLREDYAIHIAACWVACRGIPTNELKTNILKMRTDDSRMFKSQRDDMRYHRDMLRGALTSVRDFIENKAIHGDLNRGDVKQRLVGIDAILETTKP